MHAPVYTTGTVTGQQLALLAVALPLRTPRRGPVLPHHPSSVEETIMLSLRVPPELKQRLAAVAAESGVTIQSIGRQALEIELAVREEMLVGKAEREELIRRRVRSGEAH